MSASSVLGRTARSSANCASSACSRPPPIPARSPDPASARQGREGRLPLRFRPAQPLGPHAAEHARELSARRSLPDHAELLAKFCEQINDLSERPRVRVLPRIDHFDRFVSLIVYVPREDYNSMVREKIGLYFQSVYKGHVSAFYPAFPEGGVARVHIIIGRRAGATPTFPRRPSRKRSVRSPPAGPTVCRLVRRRRSQSGGRSGFPGSLYAGRGGQRPQAHQGLHRRRAPLARIPRSDERTRPLLYLKIFHAGDHLPLSRRVPLLENLGFRVISERTFDIGLGKSGETQRSVVLHDMELQVPEGVSFDTGSTDRRSKRPFSRPSPARSTTTPSTA